MTPALKTIFVALTVISAFNLGRYSAAFSGNSAAWVSVAMGVLVLAISAGKLIFSFWSAKA